MDYLEKEVLSNLNDADKILVSRILINSELAKVDIQAKTDEVNNEKRVILVNAVRTMLEKEKRKHRGCEWGELMTIENVRKVFSDINSLPRNAFRKPITIPNYSDEKVIKGKKSIFLAGPTPRDKNIASWREEALSTLETVNFDGVVYIPEFSTMMPKEDYVDQVMWEREALMEASTILFWIPRDLETMPAFTTNVEFGYWIGKKRILYGRPDSTPKTKYLDWLYNIECDELPYNNLNNLLMTGCNVSQEIFEHAHKPGEASNVLRKKKY